MDWRSASLCRGTVCFLANCAEGGIIGPSAAGAADGPRKGFNPPPCLLDITFCSLPRSADNGRREWACPIRLGKEGLSCLNRSLSLPEPCPITEPCLGANRPSAPRGITSNGCGGANWRTHSSRWPGNTDSRAGECSAYRFAGHRRSGVGRGAKVVDALAAPGQTSREAPSAHEAL